MNRFHIPAPAWDPGDLRLTGDEAHHCSRVFRQKPGDLIEVFDGAGRHAKGRVRDAANREVRLEIVEAFETPPPPAAITLAQAVPKGKTMDLIVRMAVEIGATRIVPLLTARTIAKADAAKSEKWRRVALEACKQCGRNWLPVVTDPQQLLAFAAADESKLKLVASLAADTQPMRHWLIDSANQVSASIVIGPEGDFTPDELAALTKFQFLPLSLGSAVLRAETAALVGLSIATYELSRS